MQPIQEPCKTGEFKVRAGSRIADKNVSIFKMHKDDNSSWIEAKMRRENEFQPWQIKLGSGRTAKRFKAIKEGGVGENASYFIFYKPKDSNDTFEVCPVDEWYNVSATQRYKTLTAEEAEQKFEQRHKTLNLFSVMVKKGGEVGEEGGSVGESKGFKISEMDEWDQSGDDFGGSDDDERDGDDAAKKKGRKKGVKKEKDEPENAPEEGREDSDEGDFEQREVDYMSDSSSESSDSEAGEKDATDVKGIAESEALRELLSTDDDEDGEGSPRKLAKPTAHRSSFDGNRADGSQNADGEGSEDSSDSDDYDVDEDKMDTMFSEKGLPMLHVNPEFRQEQATSPVMLSTSSVPMQTSSSGVKKKTESAPPPSISSITANTSQAQHKRPAPEYPSSTATSSYEKTIEDLIKKYLSRKPMTIKSILTTVKSKLKRMSGFTTEMDEELVNTIASIIKRLPTERQKINNSLYVSLKQ